jgi:hypothetical protein
MILSKRRTIVGTVLLLLVAAYAVFGFFILPGIVKPRLVAAISQATHSSVTVGDVAVNPFALSITVRDFALNDRDSVPVLAFGELYINFEIRSIFKRAYTFSELRLNRPRIHVVTRRDHSTNLSDVIPKTEPDTTRSALVPLIIEELAIDSGKVSFEDRSRPVPFSTVFDTLGLHLRDFTTKPDESGAYTFEATTSRKESLRWRGSISVVPLRSSGSLVITNLSARTLWEFLEDRLNFEVLSGSANFSGEYSADFSGHSPAVHLFKGDVAVSNLSLASRLDSVRAVAAPGIHVAEIDVLYPEKKLSIGSITADAPVLLTNRNPGGGITLKDMFVPRKRAADTIKTPMWEMTLHRIALSKGTLTLQDRTAVPPATLSLTDAAVTIEHLRVDKPAPAVVTASVTINGTGTAKASGTMTMDIEKVAVAMPLTVNVQHVALNPFQPYINPYARMTMASGSLSYQGLVNYSLAAGKQAIDYEGDVRFEGLRMTDDVLNEDFLRMGRLDLAQFKYHESPPSLSIKGITATKPYLRLLIGPDRVTNVQNMALNDSTRNALGRPALPAEDTSKSGKTRSRIGEIRVVDGALNFSDFSLSPNFSIGIEALNGSIKGLSSEQLDRAEVDLAGSVDKYAPAVIKGQINPLSEEAFTDILMSFRGIELTTFSPYFGKFAGYRIDKGKLNMELRYKLNKHMLEGQNKIVLDQLTLGEKVDSPDATSMPVRLAIALLKDSHGVIDLDIPVSGDINDPEFSLMPIVWKAIWHLIVKVVTSPFALLGSLFGGGDEMNFVTYAPGSDSLSADDQGKMASLAKALTERPQLALNVRGVAAGSVDMQALAERGVQEMIFGSGAKRQKLNLSAQEQRAVVLKFYRDTQGEDPVRLLPPIAPGAVEPSPEEREIATARAAYGKLVSMYPVSDEDLRGLARTRAESVRSLIVTGHSIPGDRVFVQDVNIQSNPADGAVRMELTLEGK